MNAKLLRLASISIIFSLQLGASPLSAQTQLSQSIVADVVTEHALENRFPNRMTFAEGTDAEQIGYVEFTFDEKVHQDMAEVYLRYQPDYACFVAMDVETGAILNLTSFIKSDEDWDNLVMRSDYPAASVFKMITAAAGLDLGKVSPNTVIPFNGKSTTLYKKQVLKHKETKWTRKMTFKESFAKSVNSVFGRVGVFQLGAKNLNAYASKFGFGIPLKTDFNLAPSVVGLPLDTDWQVAEAASGYTKDITLSPIHAAQMAAIVANDGKMVTPYMVKSVISEQGRLLYQAQPNESKEQVISAQSARSLRMLMKETTRIGSARKSFQGLGRYKVYNDMDIGGKTGSLTGFSPRGRHDWFVGYAEKNGKRVAYASLIINKEKWYVRSAYVARQFIYHYFTEQMNLAESALADESASAE